MLDLAAVTDGTTHTVTKTRRGGTRSPFSLFNLDGSWDMIRCLLSSQPASVRHHCEGRLRRVLPTDSSDAIILWLFFVHAGTGGLQMI